jgi:hypothetical protein
MLLCGQLVAINSTITTETSQIQKGILKKPFFLIPEKEIVNKNFVFL